MRRPLRLLLPLHAQLLFGKHHLRDRRHRRRHGHGAVQVGARVKEQTRLLERVRKVGRLGARGLGDGEVVEDVPAALANLCDGRTRGSRDDSGTTDDGIHEKY
jgi:hypothetical protein